jgi:hypothetical protein
MDASKSASPSVPERDGDISWLQNSIHLTMHLHATAASDLSEHSRPQFSTAFQKRSAVEVIASGASSCIRCLAWGTGVKGTPDAQARVFPQSGSTRRLRPKGS